MKQIPEKLDIEDITRNCDKILAYMRSGRYIEPDLLDSLARICSFVSRVKNNIEWLELIVQHLREGRSDESGFEVKKDGL